MARTFEKGLIASSLISTSRRVSLGRKNVLFVSRIADGSDAPSDGSSVDSVMHDVPARAPIMQYRALETAFSARAIAPIRSYTSSNLALSSHSSESNFGAPKLPVVKNARTRERVKPRCPAESVLP